jgi:iron complex outermembrane receptor protein
MKDLKRVLLLGIAMGTIIAPIAQGQEDLVLEEIVVTGSRLSATIETFPGSYTVVSRQDLEDQLSTSSDIGAILSNMVPGLAPSAGTAANVDQSLRGRPLRVFIDGIPVSNPLRDGGRDLRLISPTAIGSIEVIRGASALYGQGGAGGIINYITKDAPATKEFRFHTEVGTSLSTQHLGDSTRPSISQSASGMVGKFDVNLNGSYERVNSMFDADGDRLAPDPHNFGGIADSNIYNLFGKLGYSFEDQRIEAMVNYYQQKQDTNYISVSGDIANGIKETATKGMADPRSLDPENRNFVSYLGYENGNVLGSALNTKIYYLDNYSVFSFDAARLGGTQTTISSEKLGWQTDFTTRLDDFGFKGGTVLWGFDIARDTTEQPLIPLTNAPGDGRTFTPPLKQMNYAAFIQLDLPITDWFSLRAGVRHDKFDLKIDDFVAGLSGVHVAGGDLDYSATPVNIGGTLHITPEVEVFGGFSQGFSIPDIGAPLRRVTAPNLDNFKPKAQLVNNYEAGLRGTVLDIGYTLAYFISKSKYGTDFVIDTVNPTEAATLREKERIHGIEATLTGRIGDDTRWGASFAWSEGKRDADHDGKVDTPLSGRRIGPEQYNAWLEHDLTADWSARVQINHTGSRNKFPDASINNYYTGEVDPTTRVDASTKYKMNNILFTLGVNNLFNNDYYSVTSQMINRDALYSKAEGRTLFLKMAVDY